MLNQNKQPTYIFINEMITTNVHDGPESDNIFLSLV